MSQPRILIIEDEAIVALDIQDRLKDLGYAVAGMGERGDEALELVASTSPDLVLMDIRLKGDTDGITAAAAIRERWGIPVIYLTAFSEDSTLQRAKVTEPFGYVIKPFEDREIQSAIEIALYKHRAEQRLRESERRYATTLRSIGDGVIATDSGGQVTFMNPVAERLTGWSRTEAEGRPLAEVFRVANEQTRQAVEDPVAQVLRDGKVVGLANHTILFCRDGREIPIDDSAAPILDDMGKVAGTVLVFQDVSERRRKEAELRRIEWMLTPRPHLRQEGCYLQQVDGSDLAPVNPPRLILDAVGPELLRSILGDYVDMLETSAAVYERNGECAFGIHASGWCRFLGDPARKPCHTPGQGCSFPFVPGDYPETCCGDVSRLAMEASNPLDIACHGGMRFYAVPIHAGNEIVGSIQVGYGDPPRDPAILRKLTRKCSVDFEALREAASAYQTRPLFIIELAKRRLPSSARLIGEIVQRSILEQKQQESEDQYRRLRNYLVNIIDSMPSLLVGVNANGCVTQWNAVARARTGISAEEAQGQPLDRVLPTLIHQMEQVREAIRSRTVKTENRVSRLAEGKMCYEDVTVYPLISNGIEGAVVRVDDVTERVRIEEMMIQSEKMLSVGGLAAGMAHEINNPLGVILQATQNILRRVSKELKLNAQVADDCGTSLDSIRRYLERREILTFLDDIRQSGERAAEIVSNMLSFSRKQEGGGVPTDLPELLDRTVSLAASDYDLKKHYDFRRIEIVREYEPSLPPVVCQPGKIQQVLLNILRNGAEAMSESGDRSRSPRFILRVRREGGEVRVDIEDNGAGMTEAVRRRVFEPFFTTKPSGIGTGLGMSVSYFIVTEEHGGTLSVESQPGSGACFMVRLPISHA